MEDCKDTPAGCNGSSTEIRFGSKTKLCVLTGHFNHPGYPPRTSQPLILGSDS
jgi:hypothetical protein